MKIKIPKSVQFNLKRNWLQRLWDRLNPFGGVFIMGTPGSSYRLGDRGEKIEKTEFEKEVEREVRIGKAARSYYAESKLLVNPELFQEWLDSLSPPIKSSFKEKGYEYAKTSLPFLRFVMERNDIGMVDYMREGLNNEDFEFWRVTDKSWRTPVEVLKKTID